MSSDQVQAATIRESPSPGAGAIYGLIGFTLVVAPLFRSGQPPLAVLLLELLAVALLVLVLWHPRPGLVARAEAIALGLLFAVPMFYLVPLPDFLAEQLPGREAYLAAQSLASADHTATLSLYPLGTESAWLFLLVPIGVFLGTRVLDTRRILRLTHLLIGLGAAQALLGLLQYVAGAGSPQLFGLDLPDLRSAVGTYTNRNHLAGLLEMLLPAVLALMISSLGDRRRGERFGWRGRIAFLGSLKGHAAVAYGAVALLFLVGLIFTRSRAGIGLGMLGILLSTLIFARRIGGGNVYGSTGTIVASALGIGVVIGLAQVLDRFSVAGAIQNGRWSIFSSTLEGIGVFAPVGSGPGTYPNLFPAFQPPELGKWFINHAHNDYLEWLFEGGLVVAALIVLLLVLFSRRWVRLLTRQTWSRFRFLQVGAGTGIALLLLHSLVDFNLHIPANVVYFAFFSAVFFTDAGAETEPVRHRRKRRTPTMDQAPDVASLSVAGNRRPLPPDQIQSPFLD